MRIVEVITVYQVVDVNPELVGDRIILARGRTRRNGELWAVIRLQVKTHQDATHV